MFGLFRRFSKRTELERWCSKLKGKDVDRELEEMNLQGLIHAVALSMLKIAYEFADAERSDQLKLPGHERVAQNVIIFEAFVFICHMIRKPIANWIEEKYELDEESAVFDTVIASLDVGSVLIEDRWPEIRGEIWKVVKCRDYSDGIDSSIAELSLWIQSSMGNALPAREMMEVSELYSDIRWNLSCQIFVTHMLPPACVTVQGIISYLMERVDVDDLLEGNLG